MADKSKIEWTDATWNPVTGCTKVSAGCKFCYAERDFPRPYPSRAFSDVQTHPERLLQPLRWRRPRRIFVDSMSDLFHDAVPPQFLDQCFAVMALAHRHTFQILTKRPKRMRNYFDLSYVTDLDLASISAEARIAHCAEGMGYVARIKGKTKGPLQKFPFQNVWLGVSVEDQQTADERIPLLLQTPAAIRFVSYEPALGPLSFVSDVFKGRLRTGIRQARVDWVIAGGESGPNARPSHPDWFRSVRDQCPSAGVPFFFKQWGEWGPDPNNPDLLEPATEEGRTIRTVYFQQPPTPGNLVGEVIASFRFGRKRAGRLLDGREWNEFPGPK